MGKKGKKKGGAGEGGESGSGQKQEPAQRQEQTPQQQHGPPQGQQQQQRGPPQGQQQQQRGPPQGQQQQQRGPPQGQQQQQRGPPPQQQTAWGPPQGQQQQQRGPPQGQQQQQRGPPQGQQQQQRGPPQGQQQQQRGPPQGQQQQQRGPPPQQQTAWGPPQGQQQQQRGPPQGQQQQQRGPPPQQQTAWCAQPPTSAQVPSQAMVGLTTQMQHLSTEPSGDGSSGEGRGRGRGGGGEGRGQGRGGGGEGRGQGRGGGGEGRGQGRGGGGEGRGRGGGDIGGRDSGLGGDGGHGQHRPSERSPSVASSAGSDAKKSSTAFTSPTEKKIVPEKEKTRLMSLIPKRKNPLSAGRDGRPIKVITNMIKIIFKSNFGLSATHYDVKFDPDRPKYIKKPAFMALRSAHFPKCWPAFDGRVNVYSAGDLPFGDSLTADVVFFDDEWQKDRTVKVTMEKVNVIDLSWLQNVRPGIDERERDQTTMQVLDVILRMAPYNRAITVGRSFFQQPRQPAFDLSDGMELWVGMFQSAVLGWKPYFNVDVAHKAFPKSEEVIEVMKDLCTDRRTGRPRELTDDVMRYNMDKIKQHFRGLKVVFQLPNQPSSKRTVGVNGLDQPASSAKFELDNGETTTVERYFLGSKKYKLRYPNLPCLWVGSRNKRILLPVELCKVAPGVVTNRKLGEEQTRRMIRETAKDTTTRKQRIMEAFNQMQFNDDPTMKEFGLSLSGNFETVDARVLNPPVLKYRTQTAIVRKGVWRSTDAFNVASEIPDNAWTILNLCNRMNDNTLHRFIDSLTRIGAGNGMRIGKAKAPFQQLRPPSRDIRELQSYFEARKKEGLKLIVVVIPSFPADVYPKVKQQAELQVGILTQCIKDKTVEKICDRGDDATTGNILLKINSKMNGINHIFEAKTRPKCLNQPSIIFGADVTHPSPDATDIPSIAAVAASHSADVFKYNVMIRLQPPRQEIILHLEEIVVEQLKIFEKNTKCKPLKIFFYRDGVSEGQFPTVMHYELQAIRNGCRKFGGATNYNPKITFLVVQKRHHIRLFPSNPRDSDDRNGNVQAGTIVDTYITHPSHIDFYLVSHASIQGTARPTKYRCLWDDNDMSEDDIEQLTYHLCHMFSRCNRSVSYPAPTYYAHLAAFRARALTYGVNIQLNNLDQAQLRNLTLKPDLVNNNPMFFV